MAKAILRRQDLVHPQLSYSIIGILFDVYNTLGPGHKENYYQKAISIALRNSELSFQEQLYSPLKYNQTQVGSYYLDFLIDDEIVLEIKTGDRFLKSNISQVYSYLKATKHKLGILANFTRKGLQYKRILNIN